MHLVSFSVRVGAARVLLEHGADAKLRTPEIKTTRLRYILHAPTRPSMHSTGTPFFGTRRLLQSQKFKQSFTTVHFFITHTVGTPPRPMHYLYYVL
jgi:hypothetical protein